MVVGFAVGFGSVVEHKHFIKVDAYKKILESRDAFLKAGVSSEGVYRESKDQLEKRP